ncbi:MAG: DUF4430 domain-containing protein [Clostridia bacterium]|nr:DUF4430 domain-containing protein [Clostridia bacterium]
MKMKGQMTKKLLIALLVCAVVALVLTAYFGRTREPDPKGTITVTVKELDGTVVTEDAIDFWDEASVFDILSDYYGDTIRYEIGPYGPFIYDIAGVETDGYTSWLSLYVDGTYSMVGIGEVVPQNGMKIVLAHENTW